MMTTPETNPTHRYQPGQSFGTPPYQLYTSVNELLAPETLSDLIGEPVTDVHCSSLDRSGYSGSRLLAVNTIQGTTSQRYVLKRTSLQADWIMAASKDYHCRSVTLWQYGLLDQLQPDVDHAILACAKDEDGWAILMRDVTNTMVVNTFHTPGVDTKHSLSETIIKSLLDGLAAIHARFWQTPTLADPALGLCDSNGILATLSPQTMQTISHPSCIPKQWVIEGWPSFQDMVAPDVADILANLMTNRAPLLTALARYPVTLLHGDYASQNLGLAGQHQTSVIALDWQLAGYSVPTVDLAWFFNKSEVSSSSFPTKAALAYYRERLAHRLGNRFNDDWWEPMWALGRLVNVLRLGSMYAWASQNASTEAIQAEKQAQVAEYEKQVRAAVKWL